MKTNFQNLGTALLAALILLTASPRAPAQTYFGNALSFDGTNDYVDVPDGIWFSNSFTIETWVYARSHGSWSRVLDFGNGAPRDNVSLSVSEGTSGRPVFAARNGTAVRWITAPDPIPTQQWVHLAATLDGSFASLYVNGVPVAWANDWTAPNPVLRTNNYIARSPWAQDKYADMVIDELRIWSVARAPWEIRQSMGHPVPGTEPNLVALWRFDEASGDTAADSTSNDNQGTLVNGPQWTRSTIPPWGHALDFDGVDDYAQVPYLISWPASYSLTIEAWVYVRSYNNWSRVLDFGLGPGADNIILALSEETSGRPVFEVFYASTEQRIAAPHPIPTNQWVHLAATLNNGVATLYVNGAAVASAAGWLVTPFPRPFNYIGRSNWEGDGYADFMLDELRLWNVARTQAEIAADMLNPLTGTEPDLGAYWHFNEGFSFNAYDSTIYQGSATLMNGTPWGRSSLSAPNLLVNPGFEDGTRGWSGFDWATVTATNSISHSGGYSAFVSDRNHFYSGVSQSLLGVMQSGYTYNVSGWVRLANAASGPVGLGFVKTDGTHTSYPHVPGVTATSNEWTQISGSYTLSVTGTLNALTLYMDGPEPGTNFYADDFVVALEMVTAPAVLAVTTRSATNLSNETAVLHGTIAPAGHNTTTWFEWGTSLAYGNITAPEDMSDGVDPVQVRATLSNLTAGVIYHYRAVASDVYGIVRGQDQMFWPAALSLGAWSNTTGDAAGLPQDASAADLLQGLTPTYSPDPFFDISNGASPSGLTDGSATVTLAGNPNGAYLPATFAGGRLPCTVTFQLNTNVARAGYVLTRINSFVGWHENGRTLANQKFELQLRQVGGDYVSVGTFEYLPFTANDGTGTSTSLLSLTNAGGGPFAANVDSVRFVFQATGVAAPNDVDGFVIKELDVFGYPVPPAQTSHNTTGDTAGLSDPASEVDLLHGLAPTYSLGPFFDFINGAPAPAGQSGLTDGSATATSASDANGAYLPETYAGGRLPCTVTFMLNTTLAAAGYDLTQINSFAGWWQNGRTLANQKFELQVRQIGGAGYASLGTFQYLPFTAAEGLGPSTSLLSLTNLGGGAFATNVDSVRFVFQATDVAAPNDVDGFVIKELDVFGHPSAPVQTTSHNTVGDTSGLSQDASSADLLQGLAPTYSRNPFFDINNGASSSGLTDGSATVTSAGNPNGAYLPATFAGGRLPCTVTFQLNTNVAPAGYVLTRINSFAGWHENGRTLANQKFELQFRQIGGDYYSVGTFEYLPFTAANGVGTASSLLSLSAGRGVLATHLDSVRFVFQATDVAAPNDVDGFVIKELDVFGYPVSPVPTTSHNTTGDTAGLSDSASDADLLQGLAPTYSSSPFFDYINGGAAPPGQSGLTDGSATATSATDANGAYLPETYGDGRLPCTVTFMLNTSLAPSGYDLTRINSFAGWWGNGRTLANQKLELQVRHAGSDYISLGTFQYLPFTATDGTGPSTSSLNLTNPGGGAFATNVDSVRFVFQATGVPAPNVVDGFVIKELDAFGYPSGLSGMSLASPKTRQVIQRGSANVADVSVIGNLGALTGVQRIEARAVVMDGPANNGTSTDWIIISTAAGGAFSGVLPAVAAGGWYRIEVRAVNDVGEVMASAAVERIGVGDVFVTAGQSNAGCFGDPPQQPGDDRVSAWLVAGNSWQWAADPQPNPAPGGSGGSPWPILGTLLVQSNGVPVGFTSVAWGGAALSQWQPGTDAYRNLTNALRAFGANSVRAVLWHQGESDSLASTTAIGYAQLLSNLVAQSRADAGWTVPWGIAEASFHPQASRAQEEPVAAGQRLFLYHNIECFRGPRTDDFNLEGKLSDTVHFNAAGLQDHAQQWADAILGIDDLTVKNGDFEANQPLADGQTDDVTRVIGWNRLDAAGTALASGNNGYFNPSPGTYSNGADSINGGVLPGMSGRHAGTLSGGAGGNAFLQTLRAHLQPHTAYILRVTLGVRDNSDVFGGFRLDILANGMPLGPGLVGDLATLNALAGGSPAGKFTVVSNIFMTGEDGVAGQQLGVRLTKLGGASTYLDFDDLRLFSAPRPRLSIQRSGDLYTLSWLGRATLEAADAVTGATWGDVYTGDGPYTDTPPPGKSQRYYRLRWP